MWMAIIRTYHYGIKHAAAKQASQSKIEHEKINKRALLKQNNVHLSLQQ